MTEARVQNAEPEVEVEEVEEATFTLACKWFVNGFPKAGTHFATQMLSPVARMMPPGMMRRIPWAGTFGDHSWTTCFTSLRTQAYWMSELRPGFAYKSHCAWVHDIEAFQYLLGFCHVFVYRDPRDVAVSVLYHILSDNVDMEHPGREQFKALGDKDAILAAVIQGLDQYAGVMERWEFYAPWLNVDWAFKFRYEEASADPAGMAHRLLHYGLGRLSETFCLRFVMDDTTELERKMVEASVDRRRESLTFRAGRVGDWRSEFNEQHRELFKESDKHDWLIKLGYESDREW